MTADDLKTLQGMKPDELAKLVTVDMHWAENLQSQRDNALATIDQLTADKAAMDADKKKALDELTATKDAEIKAVQDQIDALGGTELAQKLARQKQRDELQAAIAVAEQNKIDAEKKLSEIPVDITIP